MFKFVIKRHKLFPISMSLFLTPEGVPMTAIWFLNHLRLILVQCNLPSSQFSGHSFRIRAATTAASLGVSIARSKNSADGPPQPSLRMFVLTSKPCYPLNDLSVLR
ncbi:hypothetical protein ILYODFUR_035302 [Ilyodon furcidens]|uniref:Uncharacterized protein n=1 Tax=Ilyodon furcidens TaxID=33524 RepID=A0ABV0VL80_9TELE